jgi:hypothetical protein
MDEDIQLKKAAADETGEYKFQTSLSTHLLTKLFQIQAPQFQSPFRSFETFHPSSRSRSGRMHFPSRE